MVVVVDESQPELDPALWRNRAGRKRPLKKRPLSSTVPTAVFFLTHHTSLLTTLIGHSNQDPTVLLIKPRAFISESAQELRGFAYL